MTTITSIPTAARGKVRAHIKQHPAFGAFLADLGVPSRDVKNSDLLIFAEHHGILHEVQGIIDMVANQPPEPALDREYFQAMAHEGDRQREAEADAKADASAKKAKETMQAVVDFGMDRLLSGVDQFLSPLVRKELEKALAPVIEAANRPAVTVEVEKVVEREVLVTATGAVVAPKFPMPVRTGGKVAFNKLFGVNTTHAFGKTEISLWNSHGQAPAFDPFYVTDAMTMGAIATAAECGDYVWQVGPSGSGKTTNPRQFAAVTGRRFVDITCTKHTEVADLVGGDAAKGGETFWQDGALIEAVKVPGTVILIDEPTLASPGVQAIFQAITDDSRIYTIHATGEVVKIADGVFFIVADNTNGAGDETGQYAGTHQSNAALVNRFRRMIRVDYMTRPQEAKALVNWTSIPQPAAEHVVDFFARARKLPEMEGIVMSLRQMTGFVRAVKDGFPSKHAFEMTVLNKLPATERAAVEALAILDWHNDFEALLAGTKVFTTNAASDSDASHSFDDGIL
jgi:MoxR-like ATPase